MIALYPVRPSRSGYHNGSRPEQLFALQRWYVGADLSPAAAIGAALPYQIQTKNPEKPKRLPRISIFLRLLRFSIFEISLSALVLI